jgi:hypothetical protein
MKQCFLHVLETDPRIIIRTITSHRCRHGCLLLRLMLRLLLRLMLHLLCLMRQLCLPRLQRLPPQLLLCLLLLLGHMGVDVGVAAKRLRDGDV